MCTTGYTTRVCAPLGIHHPYVMLGYTPPVRHARLYTTRVCAPRRYIPPGYVHHGGIYHPGSRKTIHHPGSRETIHHLGIHPTLPPWVYLPPCIVYPLPSGSEQCPERKPWAQKGENMVNSCTFLPKVLKVSGLVCLSCSACRMSRGE